MAGIEHDEICILAFGGRSHTLGAQQLGHPFAVIDVHLAAEAFDSESLGSHRTRAIGEWAADLKSRVAPIDSRAAAASCLRSPVRLSGGKIFTVTARVPRRPSTRRTLSFPGSCHQAMSGAAWP